MSTERRRIEKNKRQQKRVQLLSKAFQELQELLPNSDQERARTKAQILEDASVYIRYLKLKLQDVEEKRKQDSSDSCQARTSCAFAKPGQETSYLTHPVQSQTSVSFTASPSYYEASPEMDCTCCLTAPTWSVPNISHSDTEHQLGEDLDYMTSSIPHGNDQQKGDKYGLADYLPWI